jgi:hypothetical protein
MANQRCAHERVCPKTIRRDAGHRRHRRTIEPRGVRLVTPYPLSTLRGLCAATEAAALISRFRRLGEFEDVPDVYAKIAHRALNLCMTEED